MLLTTRKSESLYIAGGLLVGVLLIALFNADVVFGHDAAGGSLRLSNYRIAAAPVAVEEKASPNVADAVVQSASVGYSVEGPTTISAAKIDRVLASYNSPATGFGQIFVDMGAKYGINPAYALAFYIHESHCGTKGVARFTHSIGNIRTTAGYQDYEGYRLYDSFDQGIEDWFKLIRELYIDGWGLHTVAQILPRYAPPADNNDTAAYINSVQYYVDSWQ